MRRLLGILVAVGLLVPVGVAAADLPPGGTFSDDNGNVHEGNIEAIAAEGITRGCNPPANTLYCPGDDVSRGAMAAFLRRSFNLSYVQQDFFTDDNGSVFEADINAIAAAGITRGCNPPANDRFCPDASVTRGAMAAFLRRAFDLPASSNDFFTDDGNSVFEGDINAIAEAGITKGCNPPANTLYCPTDNVKRDQMASFLARALGLAPIVPPPPVETVTFGAGSYRVGVDIPAGRYRANDVGSGCYWERVSDFSGELDAIIANEFTSIDQIVDILPSDFGFVTDSECGTWTSDMSSSRNGRTSSDLTPGVWLVGEDLAPGTWQGGALAGDFCFWERRSNFTNELSAILANDFTDLPTIFIDIQPGDEGFLMGDGCKTMKKVG